MGKGSFSIANKLMLLGIRLGRTIQFFPSVLGWATLHFPEQFLSQFFSMSSLFNHLLWSIFIILHITQASENVFMQLHTRFLNDRTYITASICFPLVRGIYCIFCLIAFSRLVPTFIHVTEFTIWNQHLECAAPKRWSKYTTNVYS